MQAKQPVPNSRCNSKPVRLLRTISSDDLARWAAETPGTELVRLEAHKIANWPDFRFETADGRSFGLFQFGEAILKRLNAAGVWINWQDTEGIERIKALAGCILEIGGDEPPLLFNDFAALAAAWAETRFAYGVEPSNDEIEALDLQDCWRDEEEGE